MPTVERLSSALADRYRIERELGQGGMATVYLAGDLRHDREVAIKVLKPELAAVLGADRSVVEIIHRDIKPENILLHDGRAMAMDFGIALAVSAAAGGRTTETGLSLGTPHDAVVTTTPNDGAHTDILGKVAGTFTDRVCHTGTTTCSTTASVSF